MKAVIIIILLQYPILLCGQNDDEWLDPVLDASDTIQPADPNTNDYPSLTLDGFKPGYYYHSEIYNFSSGVLKTIENIEKKEYDIIRITIKGYADGLKNEHLFEEKELPQYCLKYSNYVQGKEDIQLATLRACYTESILKELIKGKPYYIYVNFENEYYDEPDGGKSGPSHRKIEVNITYLNK